jgi:hypothetical protein
MAEMVERLPGKRENLSLNPNTQKTTTNPYFLTLLLLLMPFFHFIIEGPQPKTILKLTKKLDYFEIA